MIRAPIPVDVALAWWREALAQPAYERVAIPDEPHPGFFQRKLVKGGPFVPARIWLEQDVGEDGELLGAELRCEVNGEPADPFEAWSYLCGRPITEEYFNYLTARNRWAAWHAPHEAAANPRQPIDWNRLPAPTF
ncbi:hypothetical protein [Taklimakanibacter deserti]|uniref:hypothetical protein n=1 Tax=Taklimakanibacter deserti TaxID=2267839 RepID=UPI000E65A324